jgi:hypothetical protein
MSNGIEIKNLPSATTIKQNDTMTIVQNRENKQLPLDRFANESDLKTLAPLETRCDEVKAKIEVDEYSAEITTSQSMSRIGSDDSGANLHENVLDGAFESCVLKGQTLVNVIRSKREANSMYTDYNLSFIDKTKTYFIKFNSSCIINQIGILADGGSWNVVNRNVTLTNGYITLKPDESLEVFGLRIRYDGQIDDGSIPTIDVICVEYKDSMENWNIPYFEGMTSCKMPILTTTGKNLFNTNKQITSNATYEVIGDELILSCSSAGWYNLKLKFFNLTPNKPYTLSYDYEILEGSPNNQVIMVDSSNTTISNNIAPSDGKISMIFYCGNSTKFGKIRYYNIQLEEASAPTSYEPYKSSILTHLE